MKRTGWTPGALLWGLCLLVLLAGCAKYNTFYNAQKSFNKAERIRDNALKNHQDPPQPSGAQKMDYETAIRKAQKVLDEYPGHGLTDDALFLQGKAYHRLESYRMSIRKFDLLFTNYPATPFLEEAYYLQALNYLLVGGLDRSQEYLDKLARKFPDSRFQAETLKVSGDNAFDLEDFEGAAISYQDYLEINSDIEERDRIGLKLARCFWELDDYGRAAEILQQVSHDTESADLAFQARLLRARVEVKRRDFEVVTFLISELRAEAELYGAQGEVAVVEAENLIAQDKGDEASPILENMPIEWQNPELKAQIADLLGYLYLERGELEEARAQFQIAVSRVKELDDGERTRVLYENLQVYLVADQQLVDAKPDQVPRLKLLQANALLFGFQKPEDAAALYREAAYDTAADSSLAARALYGGHITYAAYLDVPDSAEIFAADLLASYPDSPQANELKSSGDHDLLGYLLTQQEIRQKENLANLTPDEMAALFTFKEVESTSVIEGVAGLPGMRRRMVYLSRRDNIVFAPPAGALESVAARQAQAIQDARADLAVDEARSARADSLRALQLTDDAAVADSTVVPGGPDDGQAAVQDPAEEERKKKEEEEKKEKEDLEKDWDFLRSPNPGMRP